MKRIWFAVAFLIISISLCACEQHYVKEIHNTIDIKAEQAIESYNSNDTKQLNSSINEIKKYWDRYNNLLFSISDHGILDDLGAQIRSIDAKDEDIASKLSEIKALNEVFYENQRISAANVF